MIDDLDIKILNLLQDNAKMKRSQIAEIVGMSVPSVSERLHKMEEKGLIEGYYAKLNRREFGFDLMAFIFVFSESSTHYNELAEKSMAHPKIAECHSILGEGSHILKAVVKNTNALEQLLAEIQTWPGVSSTRTTFVLTTIKESSKIDIQPKST